MKKQQILLVLVAFLFVAATGCGKYEDGPSISLLPKKSRMVNKWVIEKVYQNDQDVTDAYMALLPNYSMELKSDNSYVISFTGGSSAEVGDWVFDGDKGSIQMTPNGSSTASISKILRLKSNELWLEDVDGITTTETHYISE